MAETLLILYADGLSTTPTTDNGQPQNVLEAKPAAGVHRPTPQFGPDTGPVTSTYVYSKVSIKAPRKEEGRTFAAAHVPYIMQETHLSGAGGGNVLRAPIRSDKMRTRTSDTGRSSRRELQHTNRSCPREDYGQSKRPGAVQCLAYLAIYSHVASMQSLPFGPSGKTIAL